MHEHSGTLPALSMTTSNEASSKDIFVASITMYCRLFLPPRRFIMVAITVSL